MAGSGEIKQTIGLLGAAGGSYSFAKKVFSAQTAFGVGWVVWLASLAAAVLYSIGFAAYSVLALEKFWQILLLSPPSASVSSIFMVRLMAIGATLSYMVCLMRKVSGGGQLATVGKMAVLFSVNPWLAGGTHRPTSRYDEGAVKTAFAFRRTRPFAGNGVYLYRLTGF